MREWSILTTFKEWMRRRARPLNEDCMRQEQLVEQDNIQEGAANVQSAVVIDEAQLPELIQKETDSWSRGADHIG